MIRAGRRLLVTSAGNLALLMNRFHLPIGAQQISGPKSVLRSIVTPKAEEVGADVPLDPMAITHEPMVSAVILEAVRHPATRTATEVVARRRCRRKAHDGGLIVG